MALEIPPDLFVGEGIGAFATAAVLALMSMGVLAWLRGPGSRPHDPPVARSQVAFFALILVILAVGWLVRGFWGVGGFLVGSVVTIVAIGVRAIARRRSTP
jgi:hypothetical protein